MSLVPDDAISGQIIEPSLEGWETLRDQPEKLGLTIVGAACDETACYSFDEFVVWRDRRGQLYWASDSGCSCPQPFGAYQKVSDLTPATVAEIHAALGEWAADSEYADKAGSAAELHRILAQGLR